MHGEGKTLKRPACANNALCKQDSWGKKKKKKLSSAENSPQKIPQLRCCTAAEVVCHEETKIYCYSLHRHNNYNSFPFQTKRHKIFTYVSNTLFFVVLIEIP